MNNENLKKWKIEKLTNNVKSNSVNIDLIEKVPFYQRQVYFQNRHSIIIQKKEKIIRQSISGSKKVKNDSN